MSASAAATQYSAEQDDVRRLFADLFRQESTIEQVRAAEPNCFSPTLARRLIDVGLAEVAVSPTFSTAFLCEIAELAGRHLASVPLAEWLVAARLRSASNRDIPLLDSDLGLGTVYSPAPERDGWVRLAPGANVAANLLFDDSAGTLRILPRDRVSIRPSLVDGLCAPADYEPSDPGHTWECSISAERAKAWWYVLTAAVLVGLGASAVDGAVRYAKVRKAFGAEIGRFQGVAHPLADSHAALNGARLLVRSAAGSIDDNRARPALPLMAYYFAATAAVRATGTSLHVHGGYGYTLEYDAQLYVRRARALSLLGGPPRLVLRQIAQLDRPAVWGD